MGYQESYLTSEDNKRFKSIVERIKQVGKEFYYEIHDCYPVSIITFHEDLDKFKAGQQAVYFVGDRHIQRWVSVMLGYTGGEDCVVDEVTEEYIDEFPYRKYKAIRYFTEDVSPDYIWADANKIPLKLTHEKFEW